MLVGDGICSKRTKRITAVFDSLTAWHCEKGAEFVNAGNVQLSNFFVVNNKHAGKFCYCQKDGLCSVCAQITSG